MTMKPSAAFALGLWTGAVVVAAIGAFHLRGLARVAQEPSPQMVKQLQDKNEEIQQLRQEQARLLAEDLRLRQTISEQMSDVDARALIEMRHETRDARRRIPFRSAGETASSASTGKPSDGSWIAEAVIAGDASALPRLESAALQGNEAALDALALLADRDDADALTHVWMADSLDPALRVKAARLIAATLELNPHGEQLLQALFVSQDAGVRQIAAAIDGLVNPEFPTTLKQGGIIPPPPRFRPDYAQRLRLVDILRAQVTDPSVLTSLDSAREQLSLRATENAPQ
jgi:hypothetical protein